MPLAFNTHLTTAQLIDYVKNFKFTRMINQWHIHHTAIPSYKDFNGSNHDALNNGMKDYHINTNKWSDIGQHFTLYSDGIWLVGRDLDKDPASILGWNTGAIAVETLGNFNKGNDLMTDAQKLALYEVTEFMVEIMKLIPHFHRDNLAANNRECPGTSLNRETFFNNALTYTENKQAQIDTLARQQLEEVAGIKVEALKAQMAKVHTVFKDMILLNGEAHWSNTFVNFLVDKNIVVGSVDSNGDKIFRPNDPITRADAATLICKTYESLVEKIEALIKDNNLKP
jgi:hypothetical protein